MHQGGGEECLSIESEYSCHLMVVNDPVFQSSRYLICPPLLNMGMTLHADPLQILGSFGSCAWMKASVDCEAYCHEGVGVYKTLVTTGINHCEMEQDLETCLVAGEGFHSVDKTCDYVDHGKSLLAEMGEDELCGYELVIGQVLQTHAYSFLFQTWGEVVVHVHDGMVYHALALVVHYYDTPGEGHKIPGILMKSLEHLYLQFGWNVIRLMMQGRVYGVPVQYGFDSETLHSCLH